VISALLFANHATACKPNIHFHAQFYSASDQLKHGEAQRLAIWVNELGQYTHHEIFVIVGYTDDVQNEPLAEKRAKRIKELLVRAGESGEIIHFAGTEKYVADYHRHNDVTPSTLIIEFGPGCPNPCCPR